MVNAQVQLCFRFESMSGDDRRNVLGTQPYSGGRTGRGFDLLEFDDGQKPSGLKDPGYFLNGDGIRSDLYEVVKNRGDQASIDRPVGKRDSIPNIPDPGREIADIPSGSLPDKGFDSFLPKIQGIQFSGIPDEFRRGQSVKAPSASHVEKSIALPERHLVE